MNNANTNPTVRADFHNAKGTWKAQICFTAQDKVDLWLPILRRKRYATVELRLANVDGTWGVAITVTHRELLASTYASLVARF